MRVLCDSLEKNASCGYLNIITAAKGIVKSGPSHDKKIPYEPLAPVLLERAKLLILTGATGPKIVAVVCACEGFEKSGLRILRAKDLEEAVAIARREASEGDIVSLSPASASFDCYRNFEERGRHFKELVQKL